MTTDAQWLRDLFEANYDFIWRFLARKGVANGDVDDAAQNVFIIASRKGPSVIAPPFERRYLVTLAMGLVMNLRRAHSRQREVTCEDLNDFADTTLNSEDQLARRQARQRLNEVLNGMPDDLRTVFILFEFEQMTAVEISKVIDIPVGTVSSRLRRGRVLFQELVELTRAGIGVPPVPARLGSVR